METKLNKALRAAIASDDSVTVEYEVMTAVMYPPVGEDAMRMVRDARRLAPSEANRKWTESHGEHEDADVPANVTEDRARVEEEALLFVGKWVHKVFQPDEPDPRKAWRMFLALGGMSGPVPEALFEMVKSCLGVPQERLEEVPS